MRAGVDFCNHALSICYQQYLDQYQTINLTTTLKNVGEREVYLIGDGPRIDYTLKIARPDRSSAPLTRRGEYTQDMVTSLRSSSARTIKPGAKFEFEMSDVSAFFDMSQLGEYMLYVERVDATPKEDFGKQKVLASSIRLDEKDAYRWVKIISNVVRISIIAPNGDQGNADEIEQLGQR